MQEIGKELPHINVKKNVYATSVENSLSQYLGSKAIFAVTRKARFNFFIAILEQKLVSYIFKEGY